MANLQVVNGAGTTKYIKSTGAGDDGDPHIPEHLETNSAALLTAAQLIDDIVVAEDSVHSSTQKGVMAYGVRQDTASALAADGDVIPATFNSDGSLRVHIESGASSGTEYTEGDEEAAIVGTAILYEGAGDILTTVSDTTPLPVKSLGNVAHDAADSGNPVKIGAQARTTNPTAVADADRVNLTADDLGRQVIVKNQVRDLCTDGVAATTDGTQTTLLAAAAATFHDLTLLVITNASATATVVTLRDDTSGTTRGIFNIAANGGIVIPFAEPLKQAVVNKPWTVQSSASVVLNYMVQAVKNI